jgi:hypothetical protein
MEPALRPEHIIVPLIGEAGGAKHSFRTQMGALSDQLELPKQKRVFVEPTSS